MLHHRLFNWHPVLMTLAFGIFMTEAVLSYKAPWSASFSRWVLRVLAAALCK
jgi:cytochrome b-561